MDNGIYYDIPFEDYLKIEALSYSGIKQLMKSGGDYWASVPWLNPDCEPKQSAALEMGKAAHCAILEPSEFWNRYYLELEVGDDWLVSTDDIKAFMREHSIKPLTGKKSELIDRILMSNAPQPDIYDFHKEMHDQMNEGKILLTSEEYKEVQGMQEAVKDTFEARGKSEVTVIFEIDGVKCKARFDHLIDDNCIYDLKTTNPWGSKSFLDAAIREMQKYNYILQAYFYTKALESTGISHPSFNIIMVQSVLPYNSVQFIIKERNNNLDCINEYWLQAEAQTMAAIQKIKSVGDGKKLSDWKDVYPPLHLEDADLSPWFLPADNNDDEIVVGG